MLIDVTARATSTSTAGDSCDTAAAATAGKSASSDSKVLVSLPWQRSFVHCHGRVAT
jgi:hypothetical protein